MPRPRQWRGAPARQSRPPPKPSAWCRGPRRLRSAGRRLRRTRRCPQCPACRCRIGPACPSPESRVATVVAPGEPAWTIARILAWPLRRPTSFHAPARKTLPASRAKAAVVVPLRARRGWAVAPPVAPWQAVRRSVRAQAMREPRARAGRQPVPPAELLSEPRAELLSEPRPELLSEPRAALQQGARAIAAAAVMSARALASSVGPG